MGVSPLSSAEVLVILPTRGNKTAGSTEAPSKVFLLFFLFSDWLKSNHLRSPIECGFLDIFSRHICGAVTETIRVTNYATSFGAKKCSENQVRSCWDDSWSVEPTKKEPLPYDTSFMELVVFCDFIILLSKSTSWTCNKMQKKIVWCAFKTDRPETPTPKIRGVNQQFFSEEKQLVTRPGLTLTKLCGRASFFPFFQVLLFLPSSLEALWRKVPKLHVALQCLNTNFTWHQPHSNKM